MSTRLALMIPLVACICGCGNKVNPPSGGPVETSSADTVKVAILLPDDLVKTGWSVTEIAPSELADYNPRWGQAPAGPAIPQFRPRYIDALPTQAFVIKNPRRREPRHGYVPSLVIHVYPAKGIKELLAQRRRAISAHVAALTANPKYNDHVSPSILLWQTPTHVFFSYESMLHGSHNDIKQRVLELLIET